MALSRTGSGVRDVPAQDFIVALAQHFKKTQKVGHSNGNQRRHISCIRDAFAVIQRISVWQRSSVQAPRAVDGANTNANHCNRDQRSSQYDKNQSESQQSAHMHAVMLCEGVVWLNHSATALLAIFATLSVLTACRIQSADQLATTVRALVEICARIHYGGLPILT